MNDEFKNWLNNATAGLPFELQTGIRSELTGHYLDAVDDFQRGGRTLPEAHNQAIAELGDPMITARALHKTHLMIYRHLAAGIGLCMVAAWFVINNGSLITDAWASGSLRIIINTGMFCLFMGTLWLMRDFLTHQLEITSLRRAMDIQILGWGLMIIPYLRSVILMKIPFLNDLLMSNYPVLQTRLFQIAEFTSAIASILISAGLLLMAWRLAKAKVRLYGVVHLLKWTTALTGIVFIYVSLVPLLDFLHINFVITQAPGEAIRIGLSMRNASFDDAIWLTSGVDWLRGLGLLTTYCQIALLIIMALMFLRAYWQNRYWIRQTS